LSFKNNYLYIFVAGNSGVTSAGFMSRRAQRSVTGAPRENHHTDRAALHVPDGLTHPEVRH
jgi:hypothetical protein